MRKYWNLPLIYSLAGRNYKKNILPNSMLDRIFNPILYFELLLEIFIRKLNILRPIVRIDVVLAGTDMVSHIALK